MTVYKVEYTNILSGINQTRRFISEEDAKEFCEISGGKYYMVNEYKQRGIKKNEGNGNYRTRQAA